VKYDEPLSSVVFKFNLPGCQRPYRMVIAYAENTGDAGEPIETTFSLTPGAHTFALYGAYTAAGEESARSGGRYKVGWCKYATSKTLFLVGSLCGDSSTQI